VALLATESIKLTLLMLSVVPVAVAAVVLVGLFESFKSVQDQVESQVIVEETMQGISIVKPMNGTKLPVMTEK
jgi:type III secretory pathway component EscS